MSSGEPTVSNVKSDVSRVMDFLIDEQGVPPERIVMYGQSLGSAATCYLAAQLKIAGVILHSPLMSGLRVIRHLKKTHCFDIFPNIDLISSIEEPVFIIHGTSDRAIPVEHGLALFENSNQIFQP